MHWGERCTPRKVSPKNNLTSNGWHSTTNYPPALNPGLFSASWLLFRLTTDARKETRKDIKPKKKRALLAKISSVKMDSPKSNKILFYKLFVVNLQFRLLIHNMTMGSTISIHWTHQISLLRYFLSKVEIFVYKLCLCHLNVQNVKQKNSGLHVTNNRWCHW